jgi:uncharacterized protein GlcG (DUF336 family)
MMPSLSCAAVAVAALLAHAALAADVITAHRLPAALANEAVGATVAACAKQGYAETAVVVDADGVRQAELRGDGAGIHTIDSANDKAYTSLTFKTDTGLLVERSKTSPIATLTSRLPHLLLFQGGLVIKLGDEVIGAIGASGAPGGQLDENCARAGIAAIGDRLR